MSSDSLLGRCRQQFIRPSARPPKTFVDWFSFLYKDNPQPKSDGTCL